MTMELSRWTKSFLLYPIVPILLCCPNPQLPQPKINPILPFILWHFRSSNEIELGSNPISPSRQDRDAEAPCGQESWEFSRALSGERAVREKEAKGVPTQVSKQLSLRHCPCRRYVMSNYLSVLTPTYHGSEICNCMINVSAISPVPFEGEADLALHPLPFHLPSCFPDSSLSTSLHLPSHLITL